MAKSELYRMYRLVMEDQGCDKRLPIKDFSSFLVQLEKVSHFMGGS